MLESILTNIASSALFNGIKKLPRATRWLLLIAALLIVIILLTLLLTGRFHRPKAVKLDDVPIEITFATQCDAGGTCDIDASRTTCDGDNPWDIDWSAVNVGDKKSAELRIYASARANIRVGVTRVIDGFSQSQTCNELKMIDDKIWCTLNIGYAPDAPSVQNTMTVEIKWWGEREREEIAKRCEIRIALGANAPDVPVIAPDTSAPAPDIAPTVPDTPAQAPVVIPAPEPEPAPEPILPIVTDAVKQAVADIAPADPFADIKPSVAPRRASDDDYTPPSESCSDFAFPGYNNYGIQFGWIKPERGAYYFYPFSDTECKNATGVYNPDNGIITDKKNPAKRIGTDAEHIGYIAGGGAIPQLSNNVTGRQKIDATSADAVWEHGSQDKAKFGRLSSGETGDGTGFVIRKKSEEVVIGTTDEDAVLSTEPYDRTFVLRQYKPIPATIVSDVRADPKIYEADAQNQLPVRATVDRNVYSDNGRTVVIPAGTLLLGYLTGTMPGPYKSIGRMEIKWYQFVLPNGAEFNFSGGDEDPFSGDAQGRVGVPGHGSTDYIEQMVMPMLTAIVPAAVNMIAPIADTFVNKIDLDSNTVTQSGTIRSSELAKNQLIESWNQVARKLLIDAMDNTVPPFTIAAGTRITVYSPNDLIITCGNDDTKKCSVSKFGENVSQNKKRAKWKHLATPNYDDGSWTGQVRQFILDSKKFCDGNSGKLSMTEKEIQEAGYDYRTILAYCQSLQYQAKNNAKYDVYKESGQQGYADKSTGETLTKGTKAFNEQVLGMKYDDNGKVENPFKTESAPAAPAEPAITCLDGSAPDSYGCCAGEIYTDMGEAGFNCCPETGGDCFPPIE